MARSLWAARDLDGKRFILSETKPKKYFYTKNGRRQWFWTPSGDGMQIQLPPSVVKALQFDHVEKGRRFKVKNLVLDEVG